MTINTFNRYRKIVKCSMEAHLRYARFLVGIMENRFRLGRFSFGLDPVFGLIPGFGDILGAVISLYIIWISINLGVPAKEIRQMVVNIITDLVIGWIPIVGDLADVVYKSNLMNLKILEKYIKPSIEEGELISS